MAFKLGSLNHAKGYVINKLYEQRRFGGRHVPIGFLSQGYPPEWRHMITEAVRDLKKEGIVFVVPKRTGQDTADHATLVWKKLPDARGLLNGYRESEGLPRLAKDLKTLLPVRKG